MPRCTAPSAWDAASLIDADRKIANSSRALHDPCPGDAIVQELFVRVDECGEIVERERNQRDTSKPVGLPDDISDERQSWSDPRGEITYECRLVIECRVATTEQSY